MWHRDAGSVLTPGSGVEIRVARLDEIMKCVTCKHFYIYHFIAEVMLNSAPLKENVYFAVF